jgi:tetratricopeptide (TPR) repeat protein
MPGTLDERAELYRNLLSGRKVLVVLDNAATDSQVLPLIPGDQSCGVLINSRAWLGVTLSAATLNLDTLDPSAAAEMVALIAGAERTAAEPEAVSNLTRLCGHLPLAIRVAAGRLASKPHWSVGKLVHQLRDGRKRLDHLSHGALDVRESITLSYNALGDDAQRLLRRLGDIDPPEVSSWMSSALLDTPVTEADEVIEELLDAQLLEVAAQASHGTRYRLHDLVGLFARERAALEESASSREAALTRALGSCLSVATAAYRAIYGGDYQNIIGSATHWAVDDQLVSAIVAEPLSWFETDRATITAMIHRAARDAHACACWELACTTSPLFQIGRHYDDWHGVVDVALAATRSSGDLRGQGAVLYRMGWLYTDYAEYEQAKVHFEQASRLFTHERDDHGRATVTAYLGMVERYRDNDDAALTYFRTALPILRDLDDQWGQAFVLRSIGQINLKRARYSDAEAHFERALAINHAIGSRQGQAQAMFWKGMLYRRQERYEEAEARFHEALEVTGIIGDRSGQAQCLRGLGLCYQGRGQYDRARRTLLQALDLILQPRPTHLQAAIRQAIASLDEAERGSTATPG